MTKLAINGGDPVASSEAMTFKWPRIDKEAEKAVLKQLHESISIYNKSGIIAEFEDKFSQYHGREHALLANSGTSAIFSMFEAINLMPGDEVLCPVYTFHATVSPLLYTGAVPIFCDSDKQGNISIKGIKANYTSKTRAVIVTHMWGVPVKDIDQIAAFCKEKGIWLLEDCSHAHGASINGSKVGSFGDAAAWSLQGQKIITGGEGGIMLTANQKLYNRALLQGHYNKRPKQEISETDDMKKYALTGMGLKLRAHPLAIALASQQFGHLDEFIMQKQTYAKKMSNALREYEFLAIPNIEEGSQNSWYAYNLLFIADRAYEITREQFVDALLAEGLAETDIPGSTTLLNNLPLFQTPHELMPRLYSKPLPRQAGFPNAEAFYNSVIKFPMWTFTDEESTVDSYIAGVRKVSDYILENKSLN